MNSASRHVLISLALLSLIISAFASSGAALAVQTANADGNTMDALLLTSSSVIRIDENADISSYASSGDGSSGTPYVIENLEINATGYGAGIFVGNTTSHLIIRNCLVYGAVNIESAWAPGIDIYLRSVTNCVVENNTCNNAQSYGIRVMVSDGNMVSNNTVSGGTEGIDLYGSNNNHVTGNHVTGTGSIGIAAYGASEYNTIQGNNVSGTVYAIYLYAQGNHNSVDDNVMTGVTHGIYLGYANNNTVTNNVMSVTGYGFWLDGTSCYNIISDNICTGGSRSVYMYPGASSYISYVSVTDNQFFSAYMGVHIYSACSDITVSDNYIEGSSYFGMLIDEGVTRTIVTGNTIIDSINYGIYVMAASYNAQIYGNALYDNYDTGHTQAWDGGTVGNNAWNTSTYGNYYNDHIGPDADKDGIVDTAYSINGSSNVDHYPLASVLNITSPANNTVISATSFTLNGTLISHRGAVAMSYWNQHTSIIEDIPMAKDWSMPISLVLGVNDIMIYAVDYDGRELYANISVTCTAPNIVTSPISGTTSYTNSASFAFSIHVYGYTTLSTLSIVATHLGGEFYSPWSNGMIGTDYFRTENWDLYEGTTVFNISASDIAGSVNTVNLTVVVDSVLPVVNITSPMDGSYSWQNDVNVTWTASDNYGLDKVEYSLDSVNWTETTDDFIMLNDLPNRNTTVWVRATDMMGNVATDLVTFYVDTVWPTLSITGPSDGTWFTENDVTIYWTANDTLSGIASIMVSKDAGNWYDATGRTNYTFTDLSDGHWAAYVKVSDRAGLTTNMAVTFYVDASAPSVIVTSHADGGHYTGSNVSWTVTDYSGVAKTEVSTNGTDWTVINGTYYDFGLADGEHTIYLRLTDNVGHNVTVDVTFTVDNVQPEVNIISPEEDDLVAGGFTVTWNGSDALSGIDHYELKVDGGPWTVVSGNSTTVSGLSDHAHTIYVRAYDRSGNMAEDLVNVTVDAIAPVVTITSPVSDHRTNSVDVTVTWTLYDVNDIGTLEIEVDDSGWIILDEDDLSSLVEDLSAGSHTITVRATDIVGNIGTDSVTIVIDLTAPTADVAPTGKDVALNTSIIVVFSEAMDHGATTITVSGVSGTVTWNGTMATFSHSGLAYNMVYTVTVSGKDLAGNTLRMSWTFNTTLVGTVTGTVVDGQGDALAGANVTMNGMSAITDADGNFTFEDVRVDEYELTIALNGYGTLTMDITLIAAQTVELGDLEMTALKGAVVGVVVDGDGAALAGANVTLNGAYFITGANGSFSFNDLLVGEYQMIVVLDGYAIFDVKVNVTVATVHLGNLSLVALPGVIEGVVLDEDGHAIAGATVSLNSTATMTTGADGCFSFTADAGTYSLKVEKAGFHTITVNVTAIRNGTTDLGDLELVSSVETGAI